MKAAALWLPLLQFAAASENSFAGNFGYEYTAETSRLLDDLFSDYNPYAIAPNRAKPHLNLSEAGTGVEFEMRVYSVQDVDTASRGVVLDARRGAAFHHARRRARYDCLVGYRHRFGLYT